MAIEAPVSKFRKTNLKIYFAVCIGLAAWCAYDAHFNETFKKKYIDANGNPTGWLVVNRQAPVYLMAAAAALAGYFFAIKDRKITADENELVLSRKAKISYDSIQKIDKTHFDTKGFFIITYKDRNGSEASRKLSKRRHDNLQAVLDHLVAKIS